MKDKGSNSTTVTVISTDYRSSECVCVRAS